MADLKCTKRLQMASLLFFAEGLGYTYNGRYFQSRPERITLFGSRKVRTNKVKFSRMVELHNGKLYKSFYTRLPKSDDIITLGNSRITFKELLLAEERKLVTIVKLQQKSTGEIVVQNSKVRLVGYCKCCH